MPRALYFPTGEKAVTHARPAALFALLVLTPAATAISPLTGPPNFRLTAPAPVAVATVDNGDFARGLDGWLSTGREAPEIVGADGGLAAVLRLNTTLTSPAFPVPTDAQSISVVARAASRGAVLEVTARPEDGSPAVALGILEPGPSRREFRLPAAGLQGRTVRLALDPVAALGRSVEIGRVGPIETVVPLWTVGAGVAQPTLSGGRRALRASDAPFAIASTAFEPGPAARALLVAIRGDGRVTASTAGGARALTASESWRDLRVPLTSKGPATLTIRAVPGAGAVEIADLGLVVRGTSVSQLRVGRRGERVTVRGRLVPAGGGLRVGLRLPSGRSVASARSAGSGRFVLRGRIAGRAVRLMVVGDRTRVGLGRSLRLPGGSPGPYALVGSESADRRLHHRPCGAHAPRAPGARGRGLWRDGAGQA